MTHIGLNNLQMICSRSIPYIDADTLTIGEAKEALFRDQHGFLLYLSKNSAPSDERVIRLAVREALLWLSEEAHDKGSFWA